MAEGTTQGAGSPGTGGHAAAVAGTEQHTETLAALGARLDHVALAVGDVGRARAAWRDGGGLGAVAGGSDGVFASEQWRGAGGGKVELLSSAPGVAPERDFVGQFLRRRGEGVHHVTIKVDDLLAAVDVLRGAGLDVVDVDTSDATWQEAFLRPSQAGGLVVQVAQSAYSDDEWARHEGRVPSQPSADAVRVHGPVLVDRDLDAAERRWALLGASVVRDGDALRCTWPDSPLDVVVAPADDDERPGPRGLRVAGGRVDGLDRAAAGVTLRREDDGRADRPGPG